DLRIFSPSLYQLSYLSLGGSRWLVDGSWCIRARMVGRPIRLILVQSLHSLFTNHKPLTTELPTILVTREVATMASAMGKDLVLRCSGGFGILGRHGR